MLGRPLLAIVALAIVLFIATALLLPLTPRLEFLRAVGLGVSAAVGIRYFRIGWDSLMDKTRIITPGPVLALGIALLWIAEPCSHLWHYLWRVHGQPGWMINSEVTAFIVHMKIIAAGLHILAPPGSIDGRIPPENKFLLVGAITTGVLIFSIAVFSGDRKPVDWLNFLRPHIEDPDAAEYGRRSILIEQGQRS